MGFLALPDLEGTTLSGRLLTYDSLRMRFVEFKLRRDKRCPACGENPTIREYIDYEGFCARCPVA